MRDLRRHGRGRRAAGSHRTLAPRGSHDLVGRDRRPARHVPGRCADTRARPGTWPQPRPARDRHVAAGAARAAGSAGAGCVRLQRPAVRADGRARPRRRRDHRDDRDAHRGRARSLASRTSPGRAVGRRHRGGLGAHGSTAHQDHGHRRRRRVIRGDDGGSVHDHAVGRLDRGRPPRDDRPGRDRSGRDRSGSQVRRTGLPRHVRPR